MIIRYYSQLFFVSLILNLMLIIILILKTMEDPFKEIFEEGMDEFIFYQKELPTDHKSHNQKNK